MGKLLRDIPKRNTDRLIKIEGSICEPEKMLTKAWFSWECQKIVMVAWFWFGLLGKVVVLCFYPENGEIMICIVYGIMKIYCIRKFSLLLHVESTRNYNYKINFNLVANSWLSYCL